MAEQLEGIPVPRLDPTHEIKQTIVNLFRPNDVQTVGLDPAKSLQTPQGQGRDENVRWPPKTLAKRCPKPHDIRVREFAQPRNCHTRGAEESVECLAALSYLKFGPCKQPFDPGPHVACLIVERDHDENPTRVRRGRQAGCVGGV